MECIYCHSDLAVMNSRPQRSRNQTWRRRLCKACGAVFTSIEALDLSLAFKVANSAHTATAANKPNTDSRTSLQPFDRDRLFISVYESLRHRPTAASDARGLADTITARLVKQSKQGVISTQALVTAALETLQHFDQAAATYYAAFHRTRNTHARHGAWKRAAK